MIPGLHINTVAELLYHVGIYGFPGVFLLYFLFGISVALDAIYSIALNIPDGATGIAPTAAQQLSAQGAVGRGVYSYLMGGIIGVGMAIVCLPLFILIFPVIQPIMQENMFLAILFITSLVLLSEFSIANLAAFIISGVFGMFVLNNENAAGLIFPMFVGFFTLPMLMLKTKALEVEEHYKAKIDLKIPLIATVVTAFAYLLPGVATPTTIVVLAGLFTRIKEDEFVTALGAINASNIIFSLMMLDIIGKARIGVAVVAQNMYHTFMFGDFMIALLGAATFGIAALIILHFLPHAVKLFTPFMHPVMKILLALYLGMLVFLTNGPLGIMVLGIASVLGVFVLIIRARRANMMGSIIFNSLAYYFGRR